MTFPHRLDPRLGKNEQLSPGFFVILPLPAFSIPPGGSVVGNLKWSLLLVFSLGLLLATGSFVVGAAGKDTTERTIVLYESPFRLLKTLEQLSEHFGPDRKAAVCRELFWSPGSTIRFPG